MRVCIGFQDGLHLGDMAFAARLRDKEVKHLWLEA